MRGWRIDFEGLRIFFSHWGLEWESAGALKSLKIQVFLIGDGNWGTAGDALPSNHFTMSLSAFIPVKSMRLNYQLCFHYKDNPCGDVLVTIVFVLLNPPSCSQE